MALANPQEGGYRSRTIVIVGAGFSGTALAIRLLNAAPASPCRIVLIERSGRFGCGLAYAGQHAHALLNVPAGRMSVNEWQPDDFREYLRGRGILADVEEFLPRSYYGDYLEARLREASQAASPRVRLERVTGAVKALTRSRPSEFWNVELEDGRAVLADSVVLTLGNFPPREIDALRPLRNTGLYANDPWSADRTVARLERVLLVGTGLTMADVACDLASRPNGPTEIVAISRRGLLSRSRRELAPVAPTAEIGLGSLESAATLRELVSRVRRSVADAERAGIDWRDVLVSLRERVPHLWRQLSAGDRRRFLRHVQPYWDVHRHQLPPRVGRTLEALMKEGRLRVGAARIVSAHASEGRAVVRLQARGSSRLEDVAFDRVINCSGPEADPRRSDSALVRWLLAQGHLAPDPAGIGVHADAVGRLINRDGDVVPGLYYLGPWLRARDLEATAVHELRRHATTLAGVLRERESIAHAASAVA